METDGEPQPCFVAFIPCDAARIDRLVKVCVEVAAQKAVLGAVEGDEAFWLPFFEAEDRARFWWPEAAELELWNQFWFGTPLPARHSPEMPRPGWTFGSMIEGLSEGEYDLLGVRIVEPDRAHLEFRPQAYPYGGTGPLRVLVRAFGHTIVRFDDGTGLTEGDPEAPPWHPSMRPPWRPDGDPQRPRKASFWDRFRK